MASAKNIVLHEHLVQHIDKDYAHLEGDWRVIKDSENGKDVALVRPNYAALLNKAMRLLEYCEEHDIQL